MASWNEAVKKELGGCGTDVFIGYNVIFTNPSNVFLGNKVRIDPFTLITTELVTGDCCHICSSAVLGGGARHKITLGKWCFIGYGSKLFCASEDYGGDGGPVGEFWNKDNIIYRGDSGLRGSGTMRIVVFGGSGGLGTGLVRLLETGHDVRSLSSGDVDISDEVAVKEFFSDYDPQVVVWR